MHINIGVSDILKSLNADTYREEEDQLYTTSHEPARAEKRDSGKYRWRAELLLRTHLHFPSTRQATDGMSLPVVVEPDLPQLRSDDFTGNTLELFI